MLSTAEEALLDQFAGTQGEGTYVFQRVGRPAGSEQHPASDLVPNIGESRTATAGSLPNPTQLYVVDAASR
jgi:hypothetical protein